MLRGVPLPRSGSGGYICYNVTCVKGGPRALFCVIVCLLRFAAIGGNVTKYVVVSVFDSAMDEFARPFIVPTRAIGARSFIQEANRQSEDNPMFRNPEDFGLYELGEFDSTSGKFTNQENPQLVVRAKDIITSKE